MITTNIHDVTKITQTALKRTDYVDSDGRPCWYISQDINIHTKDQGVVSITLFFSKEVDAWV